jgi:hypothetical protein
MYRGVDLFGTQLQEPGSAVWPRILARAWAEVKAWQTGLESGSSTSVAVALVLRTRRAGCWRSRWHPLASRCRALVW